MIRRLGAAVLVVLMTACGPERTTESTMSPAATPSVATRDDFLDAGRPDPDYWAVYDAPGTNGIGYNHPENVTVTGQALMITGRGDAVGGLCWCGPEAQKYAFGDYTFRVRADKAIGYSMVVGLWPDSERWPEDGEIDMVETPQGYRDVANATLHWGKNNSQYGREVVKDFSQWVVVDLEWRSDRLVIRYDGVPVLETFDRQQIPQTPMHAFIQLDAANGGYVPFRDESTPTEVKLYVDYVAFTPAG